MGKAGYVILFSLCLLGLLALLTKSDVSEGLWPWSAPLPQPILLEETT